MWDIIAKPFMTTGQIYVALSKFRNPRNIFVWEEKEQVDNLDLSKDKKKDKNLWENSIIL